MADTPIRRCAVDTRKSSEEGLEQDFNSLHAQREACESGSGFPVRAREYRPAAFFVCPASCHSK
jgi:hypothetical protein